jgi:hypothetical protein
MAYKRYPYGTKELPHLTGGEAQADIEALIAEAELRAEIKLLKKCYIDQDEIWVKFDGGFAEQYERIKQLQAQLQAREEKRK